MNFVYINVIYIIMVFVCAILPIEIGLFNLIGDGLGSVL